MKVLSKTTGGSMTPPYLHLVADDGERVWLPDAGESHADECDVLGKDFSVSFHAVLDKALARVTSISIDAGTLSGTPRITGTRIPVSMVVNAVQHYGAIEGALQWYPQLTVEQVRDALAFAAIVLEHRIDLES